MKKSKIALEGGRPRRPRRQRTIGLESLERRELLATLDGTFGSGGRTLASITTPGATNATYGAVTVQPDGKYIVVGTATNVAGNRDFAIARLNADGTADATFNRGAGVKLVGFDLGGGATGSNDDIATGVAVQ
ncbi:MAG: delta-60 repeat domain-containing protein, partial [Singulisphaera sp.]